jgi:hypothetical protein
LRLGAATYSLKSLASFNPPLSGRAVATLKELIAPLYRKYAFNPPRDGRAVATPVICIQGSLAMRSFNPPRDGRAVATPSA